MRLLLALALFVAAAQASPLIPRDVEVPMYLRLVGQERQRTMTAQQPQPENHPNYTRGSVPQSPLAGWTINDGNSRIIGGTAAKRGQIPWQVAIVIDMQGFCGGSIISELWVLTAAHCVIKFTKFELTLGATNRIKPEFGSQTEVTTVSIVHENYNSNSKESDIALLKLTNPIQFSTYMAPVKLPAYSFATSLTGAELRVSGWGWTTEGSGVVSENLYYVEHYGISNEECSTYYNHLVTITNRHICAKGLNGKTACNGDSGGALVYQLNDGRYAQVGIVNFGLASGCAKAPGVYSRVTSHLKWIESQTNIVIDK